MVHFFESVPLFPNIMSSQFITIYKEKVIGKVDIPAENKVKSKISYNIDILVKGLNGV